ncbi:MAG: hypothetical protein MUO26_13305 [Methanotrichaceae archaeon]|nr:hypothetical protein [Methanotrichaceae archaeon]
MSRSDIAPSRWFYAFGFLIIATGVVYSPSYLASSLHNLDNEMKHVLTPGGSDLLLQKRGEYIIYATERSIPGLAIKINNKTDGSTISTDLPSGNSTSSIDGRSGKSILAFTIVEPGVYEIQAHYPKSTESSEVVLAIGRDLSKSKFSSILYAAMIFFGSVIVGVGMIAIAYLKRQNDLHEK